MFMVMGIIIIRNDDVIRATAASELVTPLTQMIRGVDLMCVASRVINGSKPLANTNDNDYHLYCSDRFLSRTHDSPVLRAQPRIIDQGIGCHETPCQARWWPFSPAS